jgi:hypothetical protein
VYEKDYILRIIQQAGTLLRAMLVAMREQRPDDVLETSREALTLIFGLPPELTETLTASGLITLLSAGGTFDAKRGRLAAEVFVRRAQADRVTGLSESGEVDVAKALRLIGAVIESGDADDASEARALLVELEDGPRAAAVPS